jgi:hypothetical protein
MESWIMFVGFVSFVKPDRNLKRPRVTVRQQRYNPGAGSLSGHRYLSVFTVLNTSCHISGNLRAI